MISMQVIYDRYALTELYSARRDDGTAFTYEASTIRWLPIRSDYRRYHLQARAALMIPASAKETARDTILGWRSRAPE